MKWLNVQEFRREPAPVPWLIENIAAEGMVSLLVGEPGKGKSLLALAGAARAARGEPFMGFPTSASGIVIIDAENGKNEMHRRMRALKFFDNVQVADALGGLTLPDKLDRIEDVMATATNRLLILDSFRTLWGGDENDSESVTGILNPLQQLARAYDCGVILIHHTNKLGGFRGSGAIQAVPEVMVTMGQHSRDKIADRRYVRWDKLRCAPRPKTRWVRIGNGLSFEETHRPNADELWEAKAAEGGNSYSPGAS